MDRENPALIRWVFALGLAIALVMIYRSQVEGDALSLLTKGYLFAEWGIWVPFGNPVAKSTGGYVPGGLTALLVGLPLKLWMDHRAPTLLILLGHVIAYVLMDRIVAETLGSRARVVLAILYWLNPWRLYQSGWLDNSNYVFLTGAIHAWACFRQRSKPSWLHSALLVTAIGLTLQLHLCTVILVVATVLLWWRGYSKPHWTGIALGVLITGVSLIPWFIEAFRQPGIVPGGNGTLGNSLLQIWPVFKGAAYWLRYASLYTSHGMNAYDFTPAFGATTDGLLTPLFTSLGLGLLILTLIPVLLANVRWFKEHCRSTDDLTGRVWIRGYAIWILVATIISNALSPSSPMWWYNLIILHAAVVPMVIWFDAALSGPRASLAFRGLMAWAVLSVFLLLGMAFGSEQYRNGGREAWGWTLPRNDRIVMDLDLTRYGVTIDPKQGTYPYNNDYFYQTYVVPFELPPPSPGL